MNRRAWWLLAGLALSACAAAAEVPAPREIRPGEDVCANCHMAVDDGARAAQWVERDGRVRTFDEPGCLVAWLERNPAATGAPFVGDAAGGGWVAAAEAWFVHGGARTEMGFDVVAYRDEAVAGAAGGVVMSWEDLRAEGVEHAHAR